MKTLLTMVVFVAVLGGCSSPSPEPAAVEMTPHDLAIAREAAEMAPKLDSAEVEGLKQTLQSEGKACAEVVEIHPREAENKVDVTCIESTSGTQRVTHTIDLGAI